MPLELQKEEEEGSRESRRQPDMELAQTRVWVSQDTDQEGPIHGEKEQTQNKLSKS